MVELDIKAIMKETDAFCELIRDRMNGAGSTAAASTADEIMKSSSSSTQALSHKKNLMQRKNSCSEYKKATPRRSEPECCKEAVIAGKLPSYCIKK